MTEYTLPPVSIESPEACEPTHPNYALPITDLPVNPQEILPSGQEATSSLKDYLWVFMGSMVGLAAGCLSNYLQREALFGKDSIDCKYHAFDNNQVLTGINAMRERPEITFIYYLAICAISISCHPIRTIGQQLFNRHAWSSVRDFGDHAKHVFKSMVPSIKTLCISAQTVYLVRSSRQQLQILADEPRWDISGHATAQISLNYLTFKALRTIAQTDASPLIKKILEVATAAIVITDAVWMYNTAANCHSIADVIGSLACATVAIAGAELAIKIESQFLKVCKCLLV